MKSKTRKSSLYHKGILVLLAAKLQNKVKNLEDDNELLKEYVKAFLYADREKLKALESSVKAIIDNEISHHVTYTPEFKQLVVDTVFKAPRKYKRRVLASFGISHSQYQNWRNALKVRFQRSPTQSIDEIINFLVDTHGANLDNAEVAIEADLQQTKKQAPIQVYQQKQAPKKKSKKLPPAPRFLESEDVAEIPDKQGFQERTNFLEKEHSKVEVPELGEPSSDAYEGLGEWDDEI